MAGRQPKQESNELFSRALSLQSAGLGDAARQAYEALLREEPEHLNALNNLGILCNSMGEHQQALGLFEQLIALVPQEAKAHTNRGVALKALGRLEDAAQAYQHALTLDPRFHSAHNNLGNLLYNQGAFDKALNYFETASSLQPQLGEYRFMLAKCLLELQQMERARSELTLVLRADPTNADAWGTLARLWSEKHAMPEALACFERGIAVRPDYAGLIYNRGLARLLAGDLPGGFADYERRFDVPDFPSKRLQTPKPLWQGQPLPDQTLLIHAEQGLGDTLQFLRYIDLAAKRALRVQLLIQESLTSLAVLPANVELVHEGARTPHFDVVCPLLSLPHLLGPALPGTDALNIPQAIPYLKLDHRRSANWESNFQKPEMHGKLRVGLVWAGNPTHKNDANRSMDFSALSALWDLDGVHFFSFQVGARSADLDTLTPAQRAKVTDMAPLLKDFGDTAAALVHVDLLVCVDTSICHVAGALGLPVWLLIPWMPDWRWLLHREDSPWYPSVRILRQPAYRDWASVLQSLTKDLNALAQPQSAAGQQRQQAAHALVEQGRVLLERNEPALARPAFWQALRECPTHARAASALAIAAFRAGDTHAALMMGSRACRQSPHDPENWSNCGAYFKAVGDLPGTLACFERGIAVRPDYAGLIYNRGLARLLAGDLPGGFADYERRFDVPDFPSKRLQTPKPLWQGQPLPDQTLLIHAEQGLGDTLQFLRYIDLAAKRALRVQLLIQESLTSLAVLPANVELVHEGARTPHFDVVCPLLSLPHLLGPALPGTDALNIPQAIPYLKLDHRRSANWESNFQKPEMHGKLRVGLVWAGNPTHKNDANRSMDFSALSALWDLDGVHFFSFQVGARSADLDTLTPAQRAKVTDMAPLLKDFGDTAAALVHVDLLVCVDTSICHVAGALGLPVWLLIPWMPDWRWLLHREDSPWYPSVRILRQPAYRDWASVLQSLTKDLNALAQPQSAAGQQRQQAAHALVEQGRVLLERNEPALARPAFWQALRECPTHARAASALAIAAFRAGDTHAALMMGSRACRQSPHDPENWSNTGAFFKAAGDLERALRYQTTAVHVAPQSPQAQANLGNTLGALHRWPEALEATRKAVALVPGSSEYLYNLGIALKENGLFEDALQTFRRAQQLAGGHIRAALHEALLELLTGDLAAGWRHYESRWSQPDAKEVRLFPQPLWTGQDLSGKTILVHAEQGFGDTFQFLRYLPLLATKGAKVLLVVQSDVQSIAARVEGLAHLIPNGSELPPFDLQCPLLSLPAAFGTEVHTIPANVPYLSALPERSTFWRTRLGPARAYRVALVWAGRPTHGNDANRSLALKHLEALLRLEGVDVISVQKGDALAQIDTLSEGCKLLNLSPEIQSFEDTAAILGEVDELVTVDTSVAHLAGGLGRVVRVLLPLIPDWRWLLSRADSPWYPTARLYRQSARGAWTEPVAALVADVAKAAKARRPRTP
ncbi:tetratricopeptide repeat protein [Rhodoferax mekongensis]|uniref:Tetratricopeptide repeat protein n=1 Tax=Rhodoferax mekongensis TaxID=3068341 RepID=A0ABZ0B1T2_9BURK|nr:tetratricopeptide repeat protein [Rhodoferax sp. TBRC 17307]WNO04892.1 tetratricopeptide repeat protein [Rhodoferax sp. TBRC 17307]